MSSGNWRQFGVGRNVLTTNEWQTLPYPLYVTSDKRNSVGYLRLHIFYTRLTGPALGVQSKNEMHHTGLSHIFPWWRHQMETFIALLALCTGNSPVTGEFPAQRPVTRGFDVSFDLHMNKRLSKQSRRWWFETPSGSLCRHCNAHGERCIHD